MHPLTSPSKPPPRALRRLQKSPSTPVHQSKTREHWLYSERATTNRGTGAPHRGGAGKGQFAG